MAAACEKGGGGLILPLFGDAEHDLPRGLRAVLYLLGLFYCFAGVAIIADVFMAAIEKVTSKKYRRWDEEKQRAYTYEVWNATVANLTLMALGSSAPEILLNVIDIFAKNFYLEGLGPGTIVGSAAFNLEMIIAVCILSIPAGEVRYIKETGVYAITASCSIFAYVWLYLILAVISPNVVEVWEGLLTFVFFPILVFAAWLADKGYIGGGSGQKDRSASFHADMTPEELAELDTTIRRKHGENLSNEQVAKLAIAMQTPHTSRAAYRMNATRAIFGGKRLKHVAKRGLASMSSKFFFAGGKSKIVPTEEDCQVPATCIINFASSRYIVLEGDGAAKFRLTRKGELGLKARVFYETLDSTAKAGEDYKATSGWAEFPANVVDVDIEVGLIDDQHCEKNEDFFVVLSKPELKDCNDRRADLGSMHECRVTIVDNDDAGVLSFGQEQITLKAPLVSDEEVSVKVVRSEGGCGDVSADYVFESGSAVKGRDWDGSNGTLRFAAGQVEAFICVTIKAVTRIDAVDQFRIIMTEPTGGATLDPAKDGGPDKNIATVMIQGDAKHKDRIVKLKSAMQISWDRSQVGHANWASQFRAAISVRGGDDDDDENGDAPSVGEYIGHCLTMPWKLLFALVPPVDYYGGWSCFCSALAMIGFVTMLIGDMASLLGCVMCLPDDITAITFVALGTSLPDTFASKAAAEQDPHADASVGNVTGSNCVNVFLGLGMPWMIASIYWASVGSDDAWDKRYQNNPELDFLGPAGSRRVGFVVEAGSLGFSVAVFSICALLTVLLLAIRRKFYGGELGGPSFSKWASAGILGFLWLLYIALSAYQSISAQKLSCAR